MMFAAIASLLFIASVSGAGHNVPDVPNFIPARPSEPTWKAPAEYLDMRTHTIVSRDHGCVELEDVEEEQSYQCANIWLKNKFSAAQTKPSAVFLSYKHPEEKREDAYKPTVTWVENVNPWRVRGCVAHPGGKKNTLAGGKLQWLAVYNTPQSASEQHGTINTMGALTGAKKCIQVTFPQAFNDVPTLKFQVKLRYGLMTARDALVVWGKGVTTTGATVCAEEFYGWSRYHHEFDIEWYGITRAHAQDDYSQHKKVIFAANEAFPADHRQLNSFYCKNVTLNQWHYPCPTVLVQAVEPSTAVCESALVAWVAYMKNDLMTVCYADKRGIMGVRKVDVEVHFSIYGLNDKCQTLNCPANQECVHDTHDTVKCGCYKECEEDDEPSCGTNMMTYKNRCYLEKASCESGFKFTYAHHGKCEAYTFDHGRAQLLSVSTCPGLYCAVVSTGNHIWYKDAHINVQVSTNWMNSVGGERPSTHDASASWVEEVTANSFKACVMEAGRQTLAQGPSINWFAYQGHIEKVMTKTIEVGEWRSGTHCVPLHERVSMEKPMPNHPPQCPETDLNAVPKKVNSTEERWHYDSHFMSKVYGQQQNEWFKRMMSGYGVRKLKLSSGMHLKGATLMLTVEQSEPDNISKVKDAVNVWMEYDGATQEAYVCLREMQNWDGEHKGINVHWTLFMDKKVSKDDVWMKPADDKKEMYGELEDKKEEKKEDKDEDKMVNKMEDPMIAMMMNSNDLGFTKTLKFKPSLKAPEESDYAFCQVQRFLPMDFSDDHQSTVLVSLEHHIPAHAAFESMKKYTLHKMEVSKGMPMGDLSFNDEREQPSWLMPHMWRANLDGWRPHMRISKNTDYSAWVEGMNNTHIRVCQKSIFTGYHYEGVSVNLIVLPDRCPTGYESFHGVCAKVSAGCGTFSQAGPACQSSGDKFAAPVDAPHNVFYSYLAGQESIYVARSDSASEGSWVRSDGGSSAYSRWAKDEPKSSPNELDCSVQSGLSGDFTEAAQTCTTCRKYVCERAAPQLSCDFPHSYCKNHGECSMGAQGMMSCQCVPPFSGPRCETE